MLGVADLTLRNRRVLLCCVEQVVEEQNTAAIRDLCRALQQHRLLESPHLHVRSLALEVSKWATMKCSFNLFGWLRHLEVCLASFQSVGARRVRSVASEHRASLAQAVAQFHLTRPALRFLTTTDPTICSPLNQSF